MKKKLLALFLALVMVGAVLPGCGDGSKDPGGQGNNGKTGEPVKGGEITIGMSGLAVGSLVGIIMNAVLPGKDYHFKEKDLEDSMLTIDDGVSQNNVDDPLTEDEMKRRD